MKSTFERLQTILLKSYPGDPDALTRDRPLDELGVDSLGLGLLLFDAEDEFKIKFVTEPGPLRTIGEIVDYVDGALYAQSQLAAAERTDTSPGT